MRRRSSAAGCGRPAAPRRVAAPRHGAALTLWGSATAFAQLDPLLFLKRVPPTVIIVVDTLAPDARGRQRQLLRSELLSTTADPAVMAAFPSINPATTKTYRRVYRKLQ